MWASVHRCVPQTEQSSGKLWETDWGSKTREVFRRLCLLSPTICNFILQMMTIQRQVTGKRIQTYGNVNIIVSVGRRSGRNKTDDNQRNKITEGEMEGQYLEQVGGFVYLGSTAT